MPVLIAKKQKEMLENRHICCEKNLSAGSFSELALIAQCTAGGSYMLQWDFISTNFQSIFQQFLFTNLI